MFKDYYRTIKSDKTITNGVQMRLIFKNQNTVSRVQNRIIDVERQS